MVSILRIAFVSTWRERRSRSQAIGALRMVVLSCPFDTQTFTRMTSSEEPQFSIFKDALAKRLVAKSDSDADSDDLDDFTSYLAAEVWPTLPANVREAIYESRDKVPPADQVYLDNTPTSFTDTLTSCGLVEDDEGAMVLLQKVVEEYITEACAPPPMWSRTRTTECEICEREVPLTYHHLIPRETHTKVLKKKWHPEYMLNSVAWLCRYDLVVSGKKSETHCLKTMSFRSSPCCQQRRTREKPLYRRAIVGKGRYPKVEEIRCEAKIWSKARLRKAESRYVNVCFQEIGGGTDNLHYQCLLSLLDGPHANSQFICNQYPGP